MIPSNFVTRHAIFEALMKNQEQSLKIRHAVNAGYDSYFWNPIHNEYYQSDYSNYGFWERDTKSQRDASENLVKKLLSSVTNCKGKILDVACGKGESTRYLERLFPRGSVYAINISDPQIRRTRENAPHSGLCLMDASRLGFPDASFDYVLSVEAAFHFMTRRDFLEEVFRVLKPGGRLMLSDCLFRRWYLLAVACLPRANYVRNLDAYRSMLEDIGFSRIEVLDATTECWKAYRRHAFFGLTKIALKHKKIGWVFAFYNWLISQTLGTYRYVLAEAIKR